MYMTEMECMLTSCQVGKEMQLGLRRLRNLQIYFKKKLQQNVAAVNSRRSSITIRRLKADHAF